MNIGQLIAERGKPFYSFEFFPPKDPDQWPDFFKMAERLAPAGTAVHVRYVRGGRLQPGRHAGNRFPSEERIPVRNDGPPDLRRRDAGLQYQYLQRLRDNAAWITCWPCAATSPRGRTSTGKPPNSAMPPISSVSPRRIIPTWASASPGIRHPIRNRRASPATGATPSPKSVKARIS